MLKKKYIFTILAISTSISITLFILELFLRVNFYLNTINFFNKCPKNCNFNVLNKPHFSWNEITGGDHSKNDQFIKAIFKEKEFIKKKFSNFNV